ncbi:hypothetical protein JGI7_00471 [Candidatus Kryptonium thompsonii]|jgi:hypothetical protein|uniref:PqqD family protein n=1 Tax=Candidatus Kryptonium thompsonii TaxID=1633631 RepID=A0A0P1LMY0_9BACT|nr:hypothetical protein [Candidatus Kryptonium thompsoni]CUS77960.1 hypothetical protein JGI13_00221 [Candidatus Kryptonium thompsoni]CUS79357.1 hypothetical protein JGI8_00310 [Candidatus Kryptonium thompsoni]CUS80974.1 hypothetical protein JGI7_00471 [Candidatus Kryptonium thompsoni]CUS86074.1 hypothetical protein JGI12_00930 [Candidatus Kryptonium thompsoni]CUS93478.1 hypothetical protein JGI14_107010 [Candidatus Kryptonium thompsoni]
MDKVVKKKFGFIELRTQKLNEQFTRIEIDFKGRYIWTTCKNGEEKEAILELLKELFEDEIDSLQKICTELKIDIKKVFNIEKAKT